MDVNDRETDKWVRLSLWALWFNALTAVWGGGYLIGGAEQMPLSLLDETPFSSYLIPGIILTFVVGGASLVAIAARLRGYFYEAEITIAAGVILMVWLAVEFTLIPEGWAPQLLYAVAGSLMVIGGLRLRRQGPRQV